MPGHRSQLHLFALALAAATIACLAAAPARAAAPANPCLDPAQIQNLLCPDLVMSAPFNIYLDKRSIKGKKLLRSANSINNVGEGPAEIRGTRSGRYRMNAVQRVYRVDGQRLEIDTGAQLRFHYVPRFGGWYWKFNHTAQFELWRLDGAGMRIRRVRTGEKTIYCLRDLAHTRPGMLDSPDNAVYPHCNQDRRKQAVTLGTSVGWSDVYPANYYEQYINIGGLKAGCYAYVHVADPDNHIYELNESNNSSQTILRLPFKGGARGCKAAAPGTTPTIPSPLPDTPPTLPPGFPY
jgi:hypothetical protein